MDRTQEARARGAGAQNLSQNDNTVVEVQVDESTILKYKSDDELTRLREHVKKLQKSLHTYIFKSDILTNELMEANFTIEKLQDQLGKIQEGVNAKEKDILKLRKENNNLLETLRAMNKKILNLSSVDERKVLYKHAEAQMKKIEDKNCQIQELND